MPHPHTNNMTIFEKYKRVKELNANLTKIGADAMYRTRDEFLELNKGQMTAGYDSEQQRIGVYALDSYERMKRQMFPQSGGWVNLRLTGAFQDKMKLTVNTKEWKVTSDDGKAAKLTGKYGLSMFGLAPQQMKQYRSQYFWPELMWLVNRQING